MAEQVEKWRARFAAAEEWPEGETDDHGRGWEALSRDFAWALAMMAACPWARLDEDEAREMYDLILPHSMATDEQCQGKWNGALVAKAESKPVEPPPWHTPFEPVSDDGEDDVAQQVSPSSGQPRVSQTVRMVRHVGRTTTCSPLATTVGSSPCIRMRGAAPNSSRDRS